MITSRIVKKIGLEGEYFTWDSKRKDLVIPAKYGLPTDDFMLLGEFRPQPAETMNEVVGNYFNALSKAYYDTHFHKLVMSYDYLLVPTKLKKEVLRMSGTKEIAQCHNIYGFDILDYKDDVLEDGKIVATYISAGLHVHFSKEVFTEVITDEGTEIRGVNVLTYKQKKDIIKYMDTKVYPRYDQHANLKYRMKGYYENKPYGFEYRSLPMLDIFTNYEEVCKLVSLCFEAFDSIDKDV